MTTNRNARPCAKPLTQFRRATDPRLATSRIARLVVPSLIVLSTALTFGCGLIEGEAGSKCAPGQTSGPAGCVPGTLTAGPDGGVLSPSGAQCGPSTCASGCCDTASARCVLPAQQALAGKCGFGGQVCGPCNNPNPTTLPAYCAACAPGQAGAQTQCCSATQQACVPAAQAQSTATGTWCTTPSPTNPTLPTGEALARCQASCGGCCTDAGQCLELGLGKGQSNQRCGSGAGRCEACPSGQACDVNAGFCTTPEATYRVCIKQIAVDGTYVDDEWADRLFSSGPLKKADPEFIGTLIAGGKTPKLGTRSQAIKMDGLWISNPFGQDCVSGVKANELLEGTGSGVSILVTEYDRLTAADTVGGCNMSISTLDVVYGAAEIRIESCMWPVRGVLVQLVPETL
ncbi:MAG: hypothetical protein IPG96_09825 [Proteobacteria bacterium]|nr:hypothetical protein [Pseudomonadota bacterium]